MDFHQGGRAAIAWLVCCVSLAVRGFNGSQLASAWQVIGCTWPGGLWVCPLSSAHQLFQHRKVLTPNHSEAGAGGGWSSAHFLSGHPNSAKSAFPKSMTSNFSKCVGRWSCALQAPQKFSVPIATVTSFDLWVSLDGVPATITLVLVR